VHLDKRVFTKAALAIAIGLQGTLPGISKTQSADRHGVVDRMRPIGYWPVDEDAGDVLHDRAENGNPGKIFNTAWENGLPDFIGGYQWAQIPPSPKYKVESFNYCRSLRGVRFDRTNRMHVRLPIRGLVNRRMIRDGELYAYSDDGGATFHRADGSQVALPLTINPAPAHNADVSNHSTDRWWALWRSLIHEAGY